MDGTCKELDKEESGTLGDRLDRYLEQNSLFTVEELSAQFGASNSVMRTVISDYNKTHRKEISVLRRAKKLNLYYLTPKTEEDRVGFFIHRRKELQKYDISIPPSPSLRARAELLIQLGIVEESSERAVLIRGLMNGNPKSMDELSKLCGKERVNLAVAFRQVTDKLPLVALNIEVLAQARIPGKKGNPQNLYKLSATSLLSEVEAYFGSFHNSLVQAALAIVKDIGEASEVVGSVRLHMLDKQAADTLPTDLNTAAYIQTAVRNAAFNVLRNRARRAEIREASKPELGAVGFARPDDIYIAEQRSRTMQTMIGGLAPDHREVIYLFHFDELTAEQIAIKLNIPLGTVCSRIHRARQSLKALLSGEDIHDASDL